MASTVATLSDVAKRAGVSISAVSRVLSNSPQARVTEETRARITAAAAELNYRPNYAARALKFSKTRVVALIIPDLTNAVFTELMLGVEDAAAEKDYMILLGRSEDLRPGGEVLERLVGQGRVDGVIIQPGDEVSEDNLGDLVEFAIPAVVIHSRERSDTISSVILQDELAAKMATEYLISLGHKKIAMINGSPTSATAKRRQLGYKSALKEANIRIPPEYITRFGYEAKAGREAARFLLALKDRPTAIFVANLNAAIGVLHEIRALGYSVPDDFSVLGLHDAWTAENTWPPLTTIKTPLYEFGKMAFEALYRRMNSGEIVHEVTADPPPLLIKRESTKNFK
jgi:LacI family transcriptional regulator